MEGETRQYEMGYLLKGDLAEEEALQRSELFRRAIEDEKGLIVQETKPRKQNLAYPIKKNNLAYSGFFKFIFPSEKISTLKKTFEKIGLLRLLLTRQEQKKETAKRLLKRRVTRRPTADGAKKEFSPQEGGTSKESLQVEEIDKKLEEILGQ